MKIFNTLEEMKPYYNENTNTYKFVENNKLIDIDIHFNLDVESNINALDIKARHINAWNINSRNIKAWNINARNINAWNIDAKDINAWNINASDINAEDINSSNINAWNITARNIKALDIIFYAVCFAYKNFVCHSIKGIRENSKYFCLDSDVVIISNNEEKRF